MVMFQTAAKGLIVEDIWEVGVESQFCDPGQASLTFGFLSLDIWIIFMSRAFPHGSLRDLAIESESEGYLGQRPVKIKERLIPETGLSTGWHA